MADPPKQRQKTQPPQTPSVQAQTTPEAYPTAPPQQSYPSGDYSYTVELVGSIQHQLGKLTQAVESLSDRSKSQGEKIDQAARDIHVAKVILTIIGGLITIAVTFAGIAFKAYLDHAWQPPK